MTSEETEDHRGYISCSMSNNLEGMKPDLNFFKGFSVDAVTHHTVELL